MIGKIFAATACLLAGSSCFAGATGRPHWTKVDLTEATHLGEMRVQAEAQKVGNRRVLSRLSIWMNGRQIRIPSKVDLRLEDPQLHNIDVIYTASISCFDDDCRVDNYPVWLVIKFGETFRRTSDDADCDASTVMIYVFTDHIGDIQKSLCSEKSEVTKTIYDPVKPAKASEAEQEFEEDPSMLGIDSERWSMIIDRSHEGLNLAEMKSGPELDYKTKWLLRTDRALKEDALSLVLLRNRLLGMGLLTLQDAQATDWPQWMFEPPSSDETPDTLNARLNWVSAEAQKLTEIGCEIGSKKSSEPLFCSVE